MANKPHLDDETAAKLHNRLANQIVETILNEPVNAGGSLSDVMFLCESVLFAVLRASFEPGSDVKAFDAIVSRVKERLAHAHLVDAEPKGHG